MNAYEAWLVLSLAGIAIVLGVFVAAIRLTERLEARTPIAVPEGWALEEIEEIAEMVGALPQAVAEGIGQSAMPKEAILQAARDAALISAHQTAVRTWRNI